MQIILQPMTEKKFHTYLREHQEEYARDRMTADHETFEAALQTTRIQHESMLPQGLQTPGHYFFTVHDEEQNRSIGYVWFACPPSARVLSLYHILIKQAHRRKGYGRSTLSAIEDKAKELGRNVIWLNVMGHNQPAIDFYRACGYRIAAMHMNKFLASL